MRREFALGVLIFASAFVGNRGIVPQENSQPANTAARSVSLNPPTALEQFRSVMIEIGDFATPDYIGNRSFPSASRFD